MTWLTLSNNYYPQGIYPPLAHTRVLLCKYKLSSSGMSEAECSAFDGVIEEDYGVLYDAKKKNK